MATARKPPDPFRHALDVVTRTAAAVIAGYAAAHAFAACTAVLLPFARPDRVTAGTLLSFLVWVFVALYAFAARSAWRAWWRTALIAGAMMAVALGFSDAGVRP